MNNKVIKGRVWLIKDSDGKFIDNIDTDMIFHNKHLAITDINEMGEHTFGNLSGWENFPKEVKKGDIVIVGENFGSGSSRQQAVDCFSSLGISAIIAKSFGAIYKRNAINSAMPIISCPNLDEIKFDQEKAEFDLESGDVKNESGNIIGKTDPMNKVQMEIFNADGLFKYAKNFN